MITFSDVMVVGTVVDTTIIIMMSTKEVSTDRVVATIMAMDSRRKVEISMETLVAQAARH